MPLPEGYRPKRDDILIVHGVVKYDVDAEDHNVHLKIVGTYVDASPKLQDIVGLHCRHWEEGDRVRLVEDPDSFGEVIATHDDQVWVKGLPGSNFDGDMETWIANILEPMPEEIPAAPPEPPPPAEPKEEPL